VRWTIGLASIRPARWVNLPVLVTAPAQRPIAITGAQWTLDLYVGVKFPKFIRAMSESIIQKTGDSLLAQIVKQVSRRLSYKTQMDFHTTENLPFLTQGKRKKGMS
jgi:hypothetical protein